MIEPPIAAVQPSSRSGQPEPIEPDVLQALCWNSLSKGQQPLFQLPSPAGVVTCTSTVDVQGAVQHAIHHGLRVLPRAGGALLPVRWG